MICISIKEKKAKDVLKNFKDSSKKADITEIWFDEIDEDEGCIGKILKLKKTPVIYKVTSGKNLEKIAKNQVDFFDFDLDTSSKKIKKIKEDHPAGKIIISYHDFKKTPSFEDITKKFKEMKKGKPEIIKIVTTAKTSKDCLTIFNFLEKNTKTKVESPKLIAFCMGEKGKITRVAGHLFGNYLMYATLREGKKTAPGQMEISKLKKIQCLLK